MQTEIKLSYICWNFANRNFLCVALCLLFALSADSYAFIFITQKFSENSRRNLGSLWITDWLRITLSQKPSNSSGPLIIYAPIRLGERHWIGPTAAVIACWDWFQKWGQIWRYAYILTRFGLLFVVRVFTCLFSEPSNFRDLSMICDPIRLGERHWIDLTAVIIACWDWLQKWANIWHYAYVLTRFGLLFVVQVFMCLHIPQTIKINKLFPLNYQFFKNLILQTNSKFLFPNEQFFFKTNSQTFFPKLSVFQKPNSSN